MLATKSWMPFLTGFGAGIVTGILFAPEQGKQIRVRAGKFARESAAGVKEQAKNLGSAAGQRLKDGAKALRNSASDAVEGTVATATTAADTFGQTSKRVQHDVGKKLEDAGTRLQEA